VPLAGDGAGEPVNGDDMIGEQWQRIALASGWNPEMPKRKAIESAFDSLLVF
jgi:hypothetical protein